MGLSTGLLLQVGSESITKIYTGESRYVKLGYIEILSFSNVQKCTNITQIHENIRWPTFDNGR
jgi:hypothetical protein